jgi:spore maturation protein CgeB
LRIIILGTFVEGALENYFSQGFSDLGYQVINYEITQSYFKQLRNPFYKAINAISSNLILKEINKEVIKFANENYSDIIFVCKGATLFPTTIQQLRSSCKLLVNYNPDHPFEFYSKGSGNSNVCDSVKYYHIYFSYSQSISKRIWNQENIPSFVIPFGFDDRYIYQIPDTTINKFLFVGAWDNTRSAILNTTDFTTLDIYGDSNWQRKCKNDSTSNKSFQQRKLYGDELRNKIASYTATINILREQNLVEKSHNMRTFEVPGYGGLLLSQYTEEQASYFEPHKEAIYYSSIDDLHEKLSMLLSFPKLVENIKVKGRERALKSRYSYHERCVDMHTIFSKYL